MSRIGKQPVLVPPGVTVELDAQRQLKVKGPAGELRLQVRSEIDVVVGEREIKVSRVGGSLAREVMAYHGMTRALIQNMVDGVNKGYEKILEIHGIGWNAEVKGRVLEVNVGYAQPARIEILSGLEVHTPNPTTMMVRGADKQAVGQLAATIRRVRPPEPYKGKGIRYRGEYVRQKAGKSFGS